MLNRKELEDALYTSSFEKPLAEMDGWKFFVDSVLVPSPKNDKLVGHILAWKKDCPRYYAAMVGNHTPEGCYAYGKGTVFPKNRVDSCIVNHDFIERFGIEGMRSETKSALERLMAHVQLHEGLVPAVVS